MKKNVSFCMPALFAFFMFMPDAFAARDHLGVQGNNAFELFYFMGEGLLYQVIGVVMILGGFGLVGLSVGAIFGKVNWKWAAYLAFGLFICAMTFGVLGYFTGDQLFLQPQMLYDTGGNPTVTITPSE